MKGFSQDELKDMLGQYALPFIETFMATYEKRNKSTLVMKWQVFKAYPSNVVVTGFAQHNRTRKVGKAFEYSFAQFVLNLLRGNALTKMIVNLGIRKAGGEKAFILAIREMASAKIAAALFDGQDKHQYLIFTVRNGILQITLNDEATKTEIEVLDKASLVQIMNQEIQQLPIDIEAASEISNAVGLTNTETDKEEDNDEVIDPSDGAPIVQKLQEEE